MKRFGAIGFACVTAAATAAAATSCGGDDPDAVIDPTDAAILDGTGPESATDANGGEASAADAASTDAADDAAAADGGTDDAASADADANDAADAGDAADASAATDASDAADGADASDATDASDASDAADAKSDSGPACAVTSAGNLVTNAGFDTNVASWGSSSAVITWTANDAAGCVGSGSVQLANKLDIGINNGILQCVTIQEGVSYDFGASIYVPSSSPTGYADLQIDYYTGVNCTGYNGFRQLTADPVETDKWQNVTGTQVTPSGTHSAFVYLHIQQTAAKGYTARFDRVYLTPSPGGF